MTALGQKWKCSTQADDVRFAPNSDQIADVATLRICADTVAKVFLTSTPVILIQNQVPMRTIDSKTNRSRFEHCDFLPGGDRAPTFATLSANSGLLHRSKRTLLDDLVGGSVPNVHMPVVPSATFLSLAEGAIVLRTSRTLKCFERYSAASDKFSRPVVLRLTISMWLRKL
jgi:hypothetical protein